MNQRKAMHLYYLELFGAIAIYALILVGSIKIGQTMNEGVGRSLVCVSPMLGFLLALWAIARCTSRMDEYMRKSMLENIAIAAGVTMGITFTYGFLEGIGYPRMSMFAVWPVMCTSFGLISFVRGHWCKP